MRQESKQIEQDSPLLALSRTSQSCVMAYLFVWAFAFAAGSLGACIIDVTTICLKICVWVMFGKLVFWLRKHFMYLSLIIFFLLPCFYYYCFILLSMFIIFNISTERLEPRSLNKLKKTLNTNIMYINAVETKYNI